MGIKIINGGLLTTVQDGGRFGWQCSGFGTSGVMDERSFALANLLLGQDEGEAVLEATLMGPELLFEEDNLFVVTGGDLQPTLNGTPLPLYQVVKAQVGDILKFGMAKEGVRAYIAFAGGLDIPVVMGSRSTNLKCGIGGLEGRKLQVGDRIGFRAPKTTLPGLEKRKLEVREFMGHTVTLRVVLGPQEDAFTEEGIRTFLSSEYKVNLSSDRMGYRLDGPTIAYHDTVDIISDGIAPGSVQVPSGGTPIIMMADRQTTGGYAKIATVIGVDLPGLAQRMPGDTVRFQKVTVQEAQKLHRLEQKERKKLKRRLGDQ
jgi:biotin-dependent carboxylase-like uncharacterized protein